MKYIRSYQDQYGKIFGVLVFSAYVYFLLIGVALLIIYSNILVGGIPTIFFLIQLYYKNRIANLVSGIILLMISIFIFLERLSGLGGTQQNIYPTLSAVTFVISSLNVILSGVLLFSFLRAFYKKENL